MESVKFVIKEYLSMAFAGRLLNINLLIPLIPGALFLKFLIILFTSLTLTGFIKMLLASKRVRSAC